MTEKHSDKLLTQGVDVKLIKRLIQGSEDKVQINIVSIGIQEVNFGEKPQDPLDTLVDSLGVKPKILLRTIRDQLITRKCRELNGNFAKTAKHFGISDHTVKKAVLRVKAEGHPDSS